MVVQCILHKGVPLKRQWEVCAYLVYVDHCLSPLSVTRSSCMIQLSHSHQQINMLLFGKHNKIMSIFSLLPRPLPSLCSYRPGGTHTQVHAHARSLTLKGALVSQEAKGTDFPLYCLEET